GSLAPRPHGSEKVFAEPHLRAGPAVRRREKRFTRLAVVKDDLLLLVKEQLAAASLQAPQGVVVRHGPLGDVASAVMDAGAARKDKGGFGAGGTVSAVPIGIPDLAHHRLGRLVQEKAHDVEVVHRLVEQERKG